MTLTYSQFKGGRRYSQVFTYTGSNQTWTKPIGVGFIETIILVAGGAGGQSGLRSDSIASDSSKGGCGGQTRIYKDIYITGDLTVYVGKRGVGGVWSVGAPGTAVWGAAAEDSTVTGGGLSQTLTAYAGLQTAPDGIRGSFGGARGGNGGTYGMTATAIPECNADGLEVAGAYGLGGDGKRGQGGGGSYSKGADGGDYVAATNGTDGDAATGYGGGGGGGAVADSTGSKIPGNGGDGGNGVCIVTWWQ